MGKSPNVPLTSGWTVSPKYTGRESDAIPTQNPERARPGKKFLEFIIFVIIVKEFELFILINGHI